MGLLAYDPDRVGRLHRLMGDALEQLRWTTSHDPAAAAAISAVRATATAIEEVWRPLAFRLLSTDPLTTSQRRDAHIGSLDQSLVRVMADGYGWSVQADPLMDDATVVTPEEARALGAMLHEVDPRALADDPAMLQWLAGQLEIIGRDPNLSRQFLANFHDWQPLCNWLGWSHLLHSGGDPSATDPALAGDIDAVMTGLAAVQWQAVSATGDPITSAADVVPQLSGMQPYAAALLVRHMPLGGDELVAVTVDLLQRYLDQRTATGSEGPWGDKDFDTGPNTADLLLPLILLDPATAKAYVTLALASNPALLFATADDQSLQHQAMLLATDPRYTTSDEAGAIIITLLRGFAAEDDTVDVGLYGFDPDWHPFLAALVAPWLLQFTALRDTWGAGEDERYALLAFVLEDDAAMTTLLTRAQAIIDGVAADMGAHGADPSDAAAMLGAVLQLIVNEQTREAQVDKNRWDLMWVLANSLASLFGAGAGTNLAMYLGQKVAEEHDLLGVPDVAGATADAQHTMQLILATTAASLADATVRRLIAEGLLPEGIEAPPHADPTDPNPDAAFNDAYDDWKARNDIERGSEAAQQLDEVVHAFVPPIGSGEHAAEKVQT